MPGCSLFQIPVKDVEEIVIFRILNVLLGSPVVSLGNVMQVVPEDQLYIFGFYIYKARFYFSVFILHIFQVQGSNLTIAAYGDHAACLPGLK